ncbi:hypothetical protein B9Z55_013784 [Caenorhabditis nigoni]|uniref:Uncharacterized protein n=1 Tax=Caenorhabditis nigoni TaxID=1611254 RepID=A0A2G5U391_9PELO|nr:hypothetical protein B9Z55_013784 [Caenorhabditis nigoni]
MTSISLLKKEIAMSSASEASWQWAAFNVVFLADPPRIPSLSREANSLCDRIPCHPSCPGTSLQIGLLLDSSVRLFVDFSCLYSTRRSDLEIR